MNARLDEPQAGIKITKRYINNLRYADITLMAEREKGRAKCSELDEVYTEISRERGFADAS